MEDPIFSNPENWLQEFFYRADKPDFETFRVYKTYSRYISDNREFIGTLEYVTPTALRIKPQTDLADDCLFSVTFFKKAIRRKGISVRYCEHTGKQAFESIGYPTISHNWAFWVNYVGNSLRIDK